MQRRLHRLLSPHSIAVIGGSSAAVVIRQCQAIGFSGEIFPIHPHQTSVEGLKCYPSINALPKVPDAVFLATPAAICVDLAAQCADLGVGGLVCYASGFAELNAHGAQLQRQLVAALKDIALLGPNCYGFLNYLDRVALWPDQHGGVPCTRGVAIITQSGNIATNLIMQQRGLPIAYMITLGNQASLGLADIVCALLDDERVSAIGLHIESINDVPAFAQAAQLALEHRVPIVVLKCGISNKGAAITLSHTSSLTSNDTLYNCLFERTGVARVRDPATLLETLKLLHVHGALPGNHIITASCSGGEAALAADLAEQFALDMPELPLHTTTQLKATLGEKVHIANPLDYHTYIWGNPTEIKQCFAGMLSAAFDLHILILDFPRTDRCDDNAWRVALEAFIEAHRSQPNRAALLCSLHELLPETIALQLFNAGIVPLQGFTESFAAIAASVFIGKAQQNLVSPPPLLTSRKQQTHMTLAQLEAFTPLQPIQKFRVLNEWESKQALAAFGLEIAEGFVLTQVEIIARDAVYQAATKLGYPLVLKAIGAHITHKTELGAVVLNISNQQALDRALDAMSSLSKRFLLEKMLAKPIVELIIGIQRDSQFGMLLTLGAGGVFVEVLNDVQHLLLPATPEAIRVALKRLRIGPIFQGYRGMQAVSLNTIEAAVTAVCNYAKAHHETLLELDVNPLMVYPQTAIAVDALIKTI